jgi:hypothetical protein
MLNETTLIELDYYCQRHNKEAIIRHGQLRGFKGKEHFFKTLGVDRI